MKDLLQRLGDLLANAGGDRLAAAVSLLGDSLGVSCALWSLDRAEEARLLAAHGVQATEVADLAGPLAELAKSLEAPLRRGEQDLDGGPRLSPRSRLQLLWPLETAAGRGFLVLESEGDELPDITAAVQLLRLGLELCQTQEARTEDWAKLQDLESQQEMMGHIVDALPVGLYVVDRDCRIVAWNRKRETGTQGVAREDAIGRSVFEVLYRQPSDRLQSELEEVFQMGEIQRYEVESTASGEARYYRLTKVPMRLGDGDEVTHVITVGEDITEQKRVSSRISHAEKLAALGQMAAGVMHEINNPLATIAASAEALRELNDSESEEFEFVSMIETEVDRCKRIARDLLAFSRPPPSEKGPVDVQETVEETLNLLRHHDRFKKIKVQREYVYDLPLVWANSERLIQVFVALALNALDAMEDDGELRVRTELLEEDDDVGISFIDTGCGIAPTELSKIFEPFYTSKPLGKGTGLGLSICYGIIQEHGGRIDVDSDIGVGTNFRVVLPAYKESYGPTDVDEPDETGE